MVTIDEKLERTFIPHLKNQFRLGLPILFTGAGFSLEARNLANQELPTYRDLQHALWNLCFPKDEFEDCSLQDLYEHAHRRHAKEMVTLLQNLLTIDPGTLPDWYQDVFSLPWYRCYTLNVDNLADAANSKFDLPRPLCTVSATQPMSITKPNGSCLEMIHLNGTLEDLPDNVTFSLTQFADPSLHRNQYYQDLSAHLVSRPVIIIGTRLNEPPLWQHIEYRRTRGRKGLRELRPRSYLVIPDLDRARRALLADLNIEWIPMKAEQFMDRVLNKVRKEAQPRLSIFLQARSNDSGTLPVVADLATHPHKSSEFLLGQEPIWADLQSGRAVERSIDRELWTKVESHIESTKGGLIVVTGTAGSGKSTSLMRVCLRLQGEGIPVGWIDREHMLSQRAIREVMRKEHSPRVLAIDDADMYGAPLTILIRNLIDADNSRVVLVAIRSSRVDKVINRSLLRQITIDERSMPHLTNDDIEGLIDVLDKYNRLGFMKGMSRKEQYSHLQDQAGRQLLVAMIQATSDRRFDEKVIDELATLATDHAKIYAFVSVAHSFRFGLEREEIFLAIGSASNESLNAADQLVNRKIVNRSTNGLIWARHRVIAEIIHDELQKSGQIKVIIEGLARLAAAKVHPGMPKSHRLRKMLQTFLNHDYLLRVLGLEAARNLYSSLESSLTEDYHYWLQRGSVEVEEGDLDLADQFLSQSRSIAGHDPMVQNEWAYLLFRRAIENPQSKDSPKLVEAASAILEDLIDMPDRVSSYPYHVFGSQGLAWARRGVSVRGKEPYLRSLLTMLQKATRKFPREKELEQLREDVQREYLGISVRR